jgi:hypothetical protein
MRFTFILALALCLSSCSTEQKEIFSTENLPSQNFTINISRDTTIRTAKGTWLDIPKGSIEADEENVTIEIKEAFSLADMIKAGLTTESNGQPLSSGGMIYINANENARIVKPIRIATPSGFLENNMQLFKGDRTEDGKINWVEPKPLEPNEQLAANENGRQIFQQNCRSCHTLDQRLTGPPLANFVRRIPQDRHEADRLKLYAHDIFIKNYRDERTRTDSSHGIYPTFEEVLYACNLRSEYGTIGQSFPDLKRDQWASIYAYLLSETNRLNIPYSEEKALFESCVDSCAAYINALRELKQRKEDATAKRNEKIDDNGTMTENTNIVPENDEPGSDTTTVVPIANIDRVEPDIYQAQYYQFKIESFGWYNIDQLMKGIDGVIDAELLVNVRGNYTDRVNLFLIIPSRKVNVEGEPSEKGNGEYAFYTKDGKLPLPAGQTCYILAVSEENDEMAYALKSFTAAASQTFDIELQKTSKKEFNKAMNVFDDNSIKIKASNSKNAKDIRKLDKSLKKIEDKLKEAEKLKPKNCDCHCGDATTSDAIISESVR